MNICIDHNGTIQPLFPICDTIVDSDMLDDADKALIGTEYPDHGSSYSKLTDALQDLISTDCCGIVLNGTDILYSPYDTTRSYAHRERLYTDIHSSLLSCVICTGKDAFLDVYIVGGHLRGIRTRKYRVHYKADINSFAVSMFIKREESRMNSTST